MDNEVVAIVNNYTLKQYDFKTLNDGEWLNDMVIKFCAYLCIPIINNYMSLIMDKFVDMHILYHFLLYQTGYHGVSSWYNSIGRN